MCTVHHFAQDTQEWERSLRHMLCETRGHDPCFCGQWLALGFLSVGTVEVRHLFGYVTNSGIHVVT